MIGLLQRVRRATVDIDGETVARIGTGLLVFVGIERGDGEAQAQRLLERLLGYRVFEDEARRMNLSLRDLRAHGVGVGAGAGAAGDGSEGIGGLLLVSQFTLAADTDAGTRASFTTAMAPDEARRLYAFLVERAQALWPGTQSGVFGADMQVGLVNDGPVTFLLRVR